MLPGPHGIAMIATAFILLGFFGVLLFWNPLAPPKEEEEDDDQEA